MEPPKLNRLYLTVVLLTMLVLPVLCGVINFYVDKDLSGDTSFSLALRMLTLIWFVFWGVGIRLIIAGLRQIFQPAFTAREIFHLTTTESHIVIKELGFANLTTGLMATASLFFHSWVVPAACMGVFFYGIAGIQHIIKKPASPNEWVALLSDCGISLVLLFGLT